MSTAVAQASKDITQSVLTKVEAFQTSGELQIPEDYSPQNALKSAYLMLTEAKTRDNKPVLEHCSNESVAQALLKMVVWGVSPLKGQVYFIPYGNKLEASISYTGNIALAKRYGKLKHIHAQCVMEGDEFDFAINHSNGTMQIKKHKQTLESLGSDKIKAVYAVYELEDGTKNATIMTMDQVKKSWNQGATKGASPAHKNFPGEMAKKTVLNRACKLLIRSSDDKVLYSDEDTTVDVAKEDVAYEVEQNANQETIDIQAVEVKEDKPQF